MKLNEEKSLLSLDIKGDMTGPEVERLISDLAEARGLMEPPVPLELPAANANVILMTQDDPSITAIPFVGGGVSLYIRNNSLGWMVFNLPPNVAIDFRDFLNDYTNSDLFKQQVNGDSADAAH